MKEPLPVSIRIPVACAAAALSLAASGSADAARPATTPLRAIEVSGPPATTVDAGAQLTIKGTVRNASRSAVRGGRITIAISRTEGTRPRGVVLAAVKLKTVRAGRSATFGTRVTIGRNATGAYHVVVCTDSANRRARCATLQRRLRIEPGHETTPTPPAPPVQTPPSRPLPLDDDIAIPPDPREQIVTAITADALRGRAAALQAIADANGGIRATGTAGYDDSVAYVVGELAKAGYQPHIQPFQFEDFRDRTRPTFSRTAPSAAPYTYDTDFLSASGSGSGTASGTVVPVDVQLGLGNANTSACTADDFVGFPAGSIALVQRGTCPFEAKAHNAARAGAAGIVFFNQGDTADPERTESFRPALDTPVDIPALGVSYSVGADLATTAGSQVTFTTDTQNATRTSYNVIADTPGGNAARTIVVGSHLDSVDTGPGINDNGSGTAFNLELATQMAKLGITPVNRVRFAFFGAEEDGLRGSSAYIAKLSGAQAGELAMMLNFDMLASPNYARFVYDGAGGPAGSQGIQEAFTASLASRGLASAPIALGGRADSNSFWAAGIPSGGLFSGAEQLKTQEQVALFGGQAGVAFDPNYHQATDTLANLNMTGFMELAGAAADVTMAYAMNQGLPAPTTMRERSARVAALDAAHARAEYLGAYAQR